MSARKFAIAGDIMESVWYWTGEKRIPWTTLRSGTKTWATRETAETWLPRVPAGPARNLRVLEVAP